MAHAKRSPSSAFRWSQCTMSPFEEAGKPDNGSDAAQWGTAAHLVSSTCLESFGLQSPADFLGATVAGWIHPESDSRGESIFALGDEPALGQEIVWTVEITPEMVDCCNTYVGYVQALAEQTGGEMHIEVRVPIDHITGEAGAGGTADCVIVCEDAIHVVDLKGGQGRVGAYDETVDVFEQVVRTPNHQLAMYGDGALRAKGTETHQTIHLHIVQPRLKHLSVHTLPVTELLAFTDTLRQAVKSEPVYAPDADRCHFCKANGNCKGQREAIVAGFLDAAGTPKPVTVDSLGEMLDLLPLLKKFIPAVEAHAYTKLEAGETVLGKDGAYKMIEGRMGARKWSNEEEVEAEVTKMRVKQADAYNITFKSPAQLEEALAKEMPRNWKRLATFIKQEPTKPTIANAKNPKPAINPLQGFTDSAVSEAAN